MNPDLLEHYRRELQHIREMGGEFAAEYPKIAGRLGLESMECADPYVERLLEGFAFLAARVQLKIDTSYSKLARHLMDMIYPDLLSPIPSMLIAHFHPSMAEGSLAGGYTIERGSILRSQTGPEADVSCQFVTSADVTLWPIELVDSRILSSKAAIEAAGITSVPSKITSGIALKITTQQGLSFSQLAIDKLSVFIRGADEIAPLLYEQILRHCDHVAVITDQKAVSIPSKNPVVQRVGFAPEEALLPVNGRYFDGYRVLREYFAFPERFLFFNIVNLEKYIQRCESKEIELVFLFSNNVEHNAEFYTVDNFLLNCSPAVNLFSKKADRIHLNSSRHEFHVVPDRSRPMDFEVHKITSVEGIGNSGESTLFQPYFNVKSDLASAGEDAYFSVKREKRLLSAKQKRVGPRSSYIGSELFLSLVDRQEAPYKSDLRQLVVNTMCTNRDLPLQIPVGRLETDLVLETGAPVSRISCVAGPTSPVPSSAHNRDAWQLISNLSLNYMSIGDLGEEDSAAMLRRMLESYSSGVNSRQVEGIVGITAAPIVRQRRFGSHYEIAHGTQIKLTLDESAFEGTGAYLMGSVLENFFANYAGINSFTETVVETVQRGEIERWPVKIGTRSQV